MSAGDPADVPCGYCQSPVRIVQREGKRRMAGPTPIVDVRVCTKPDCQSKTGPRLMGVSV